VNSPRDSPVFDGSDTSLGSDGAFIPHEGMQLIFPGYTTPTIFQPGTGGGCVTKGPFKDLVLHLGPVARPIYGTPNTTSAADPSQDNPRCLKRDLNPSIAKQWTSFRNTTELILYKTNIASFQGEFVRLKTLSPRPITLLTATPDRRCADIHEPGWSPRRRPFPSGWRSGRRPIRLPE